MPHRRDVRRAPGGRRDPGDGARDHPRFEVSDRALRVREIADSASVAGGYEVSSMFRGWKFGEGSGFHLCFCFGCF